MEGYLFFTTHKGCCEILVRVLFHKKHCSHSPCGYFFIIHQILCVETGAII